MRRFWMLLLTLIALLIVLAVPAMAAECCGEANHCSICCDGNHEGWTQITADTTGISASGNYYIATEEGVALEKSFVISKKNINVTICLNGREWKGELDSGSTTNRKRPLSVTGALTLNIVDCSAQTDGVSAGKLTGADLTWRTKNNNASRGGNVYAISSGIINIYNGTYVGGTAFSGGNFFVSSNGKINVYGGILVGGEAKTYSATADGKTSDKEGMGGNVCVDTNGTFLLGGAKIVGGIVPETGTSDNCMGPTVFVRGTFTAQNNATITAYDGETLASKGYNGGLITILGDNASFSATDTTIVGGKSTNAGGALRVTKANTVQITGGTITGGDVKTGAAIHAGGAANITLSGVTVQAGNATYEAGVSGSHGLIYVTNSGAVVTLEEETVVDASAAVKVDKGAAISITAGADLTIDGGIVYGGSAANRGGAVYMKATGATITLQNNASIIGGTAADGGSVYVESGTFAMDGTSSITGGTATENGGAVYVAGGEFAVNGGTITGGTATENGGAVYVAGGEFAVNGGTITGGTATGTEDKVTGNGGAIYQSAGSVSLTNGATVSDSSANMGGLAYINGENAQFTSNGTVFTCGHSTKGGGAIRAQQSAANGVSITGGEISNNTTGPGTGGAALIVFDAEVTLENVEVSASEQHENTYGIIHIDHANAVVTVKNATVDAGGVKKIENGAAFYINNGALTLENTEVYGGNATNGGAVHMTNGTFTMKGSSTIYGGTASNGGGSVYMNGGVFNFYGGTITGGEAKYGGNVYVYTAGSKARAQFNAIPDPENPDSTAVRVIENGSATNATNGGGNIRVKIADVILDGVTVQGGAAPNTDAGANIRLEDNYTFTVKGGTKIAGGVIANNVGTNAIVLEGNVTIASEAAPSLKLLSGVTLDLTKLGAEADVKVTCGDPTAAFSTAADDAAAAEAWAACFTAEQSDYVVSVTEANALCLITRAGSAQVNGGLYYPLAAAVQKAGEDGVVRLLGDCADSITIPDSLYLDLNGHDITGDVTVSSGTLKLADSAAVNYTYEEGVNGVITGSITGTVARSFTTNDVRDQFGDHNYRFLVLQTKDALGNVIYTSHRIYLAVKSVVLSPAKPAMNYRTALRCDDMVAQYISGYGIIATADMEDAKPVSSQYNTKLVGGNSAANERITQLNNILMPEQDMATQILHAETDIIACAYITLTDLTGGEITSAAVTKSLKTVVQAVDKMTDVNPLHQTYLADMYANYTELMTREGWGLTTIPTYTPSTEE